MRANIDTVRGWVAAAKRIVVLTGAGISTESGIPDFRGPNGLWTRDPEAEKLSDIRYYLADPGVRRKAWQKRLTNPAWTAQPNAGHKAIVELERRGQLHALVTQNIDGLHQKAGNSPEKVIEVHGTMHSVLCWDCNWTGPMLPALERVRAGEEDPACAECGGILKSATILFGEGLRPGVMERALQAAVEADLLIAVGTTLQVYPVAGVVPAAKEAGARLVILNADPTQFDRIADAVLHSPIGETLPLLAG
ncbi:MAG: Sir2 family NAD-dependent protein deacetylase [Proteobacteria bacterium]|nr:Sir2 family NAD-dependent protein deacetylase [Pseudomonadota bacterium]